jgi:AraC-like DNA-binding protein
MEHTGLPHDHGEEQNHTAAMRELLRDEGHFQRIADIFRQLGDPSRIRIFWLLCHCEECVVNIADMVDMSSPAVSHHLRVLKDSGLLDSRRDGREVYYRAADAPQSRLLHEMIEQVMDVACPQWREEAEQVKIIREIHDHLTEHMEQRVTIEELSHRYLINPTTLKTVFKEVYGNSLAAHMKEHRMEKAAALLRETDMSVAEIAGQVGYESQSKFTAAFKEQFGQLPTAYRRT